jgi:hypothetical protein
MTVRDNLDAGKYENKVPASYEILPVDPDNMTVRQAEAHREAEKEKKRTQRQLHRQEQGRITAMVKADLEAEHGIAGHPKADKLWSLAWDDGHSAGYYDVIGYYEEFVELVKD